MKKLLFLALIGLSIASCKKDQANSQTTTTDSLKVTFSNFPANTTYSLSASIDNSNVLSIPASTSTKTYAIAAGSGHSFIFNWGFTLSGKYQGTGTFTLMYKGKSLYTFSGLGGSYAAIVP